MGEDIKSFGNAYIFLFETSYTDARVFHAYGNTFMMRLEENE